MSRVKSHTLSSDPSPSQDVVGYFWYAAPANDGQFLAKVDAGNVAPLNQTPTSTPSFTLVPGALPEGTYQFAECAVDSSGNVSDVYQAPVWVNVPLDLTAPLPPTNGQFS